MGPPPAPTATAPPPAPGSGRLRDRHAHLHVLRADPATRIAALGFVNGAGNDRRSRRSHVSDARVECRQDTPSPAPAARFARLPSLGFRLTTGFGKGSCPVADSGEPARLRHRASPSLPRRDPVPDGRPMLKPRVKPKRQRGRRANPGRWRRQRHRRGRWNTHFDLRLRYRRRRWAGFTSRDGGRSSRLLTTLDPCGTLRRASLGARRGRVRPRLAARARAVGQDSARLLVVVAFPRRRRQPALGRA